MSEEPIRVYDQDQHEFEVLDALPVLAEQPRVIARQRSAGALTPATVQTVAVVSAASVVAGAAAATLVRRRRQRRLERRRRRVLAPVLASRSFLVDVHVLGERK